MKNLKWNLILMSLLYLALGIFLLAVPGLALNIVCYALGGVVLAYRLAGLESFGVAYLAPFASNAGRRGEGHAVLRRPLPEVKTRPGYLKTKNRRNQG